MSDVESRRCLVTGATGYIGGHLAGLLVERGQTVRALARKPEKLRDAPWRDKAEVVRGDLSDPDSLVAAFDGVDVVYYLVHSMGTSSDFVRAEEESARNVAAAAQTAGVRRIVYLSGLHPTGELSRHLRSRNTVGEDPDGLERRDRRAAGGHRRRLGFRVVRDGPPSHRPAAGDDHPEVGAQQDPADLHRRRAALPGRSGRRTVPGSRTFDVGCPDVLEYGDAMQIYAEEAGLRRRVIVALPLLTPMIASWWVGSGDADPLGSGPSAGRVARARRGDVRSTTSTPSSRRRPAG